MIKSFLLIMTLILSIEAISQTKRPKGSIGISVPVIWNNSDAVFYRLGTAMYPHGEDISYGINFNYSRTLYKNIYGIIGIGYFKQSFGIKRPFNYESFLGFLFETDSYRYDNTQLYGGVGFKQLLTKTVSLNVNITYNQYYSFRQKYINHSPLSSQINRKFISIGRMINFNIGMRRNITQKIALGVDAILPVITHWNTDEIFIKNYSSNNEQRIARNKFSMGTNISFNYNL